MMVTSPPPVCSTIIDSADNVENDVPVTTASNAVVLLLPPVDAVVVSSPPTTTTGRFRKRSTPTATTIKYSEDTDGISSDAKVVKRGRKPRKTGSKSISDTTPDSTTATTGTTTAASRTAISPHKKKMITTQSPPPKHILVLDNGSDTVKYGWSTNPQQLDDNITQQQQQQTQTCQCMPNVTARLAQQWTILIGDEILTQVKNPNVSCIAVTRSCMERGMITNMGNQIQIWKHILDTLHITLPVKTQPTETSITFGWNNKHQKSNNKNTNTNTINDSNITDATGQLLSTTNTKKLLQIPSNQCGVMIGLPPYTPRSIIELIMSIWYDEFHFTHVGFCISTVTAAIYRPIPSSNDNDQSGENIRSNISNINNNNNAPVIIPIACVVDLGYSATHIIPLYDNKVIPVSPTASHTTDTTHKGTIRRIPLGGKHLINLLKYYCSYRQWNLMDSEWIVRDVFEKTAFVSMSFLSDVKIAQTIPFGRRPYDCEYILPNYDTTFIGKIQIPESVTLEIERRKQQLDDIQCIAAIDEENDEDEDDEDYDENDIQVDDVDDENDDYEDDDENESPDQIRQRLMKQREEERRLREIEEEQHQILNVSTERFAIPESLFRPSDIGLPSELANVPQAIVQSIEACPPIYRPGLYLSIQLTGGLSRLPNLQERLLVELRALAPCQYPLNIAISDSPIDQAWKGAATITRQDPLDKWSVSREEWDDMSKRGAWKRLHMNNGGHFI